MYLSMASYIYIKKFELIFLTYIRYTQHNSFIHSLGHLKIGHTLNTIYNHMPNLN